MQGSPASSCVAATPLRKRGEMSHSAMTVYGFAAASLVLGSSSAVTPLYRVYQQTMHLTPLMTTLIFAVYAFSLLAALLTVGGLSDYVGRKPVILGGLLLNAVAMVLFATATDVGQLILARAVQGLCVGASTTTLGAAILDTDRVRGPLLNSVTAFVGLLIGVLCAAGLVSFAPDPMHLTYEVLFVVTALMILLLWFAPETSARKPGAWGSLRPHVALPRQSRAAFLQIAPVTVACWALGAFYLSLMPTIVASAIGINAPWVGGIVVATLMLTAALSVGLLQRLTAQRMTLIGTTALSVGVAASLIGVWQHSVAALFAGAAIAGIGFGAAFAGALRTILPTAEPHQRAGLLATFYVMSYLAFSFPALAAGLAVPLVGLVVVAYVYGGLLILLAILSMVASLRATR